MFFMGRISMERTLSIIKPDATTRHITGQINAMIENAGLKIVAQKMIKLSKTQAERFYQEHQGKTFFENLIQFMSSAPVVVQVLEADDAIARYRKIMGATNPAVAEEGTIRKTFALSIDKNSVHGSDSAESAAREINFFFSQIEIF
jgi:nucleoside-diphosphate kinase